MLDRTRRFPLPLVLAVLGTAACTAATDLPPESVTVTTDRTSYVVGDSGSVIFTSAAPATFSTCDVRLEREVGTYWLRVPAPPPPPDAAVNCDLGRVGAGLTTHPLRLPTALSAGTYRLVYGRAPGVRSNAFTITAP